MKIMQSGTIPLYPKIRGDRKNLIYPCYVEDKLDGEANIYINGQLISKSSGKCRTDTPITNVLSHVVPKDTILFGELHWGLGKFGALYDLLSHAKDDGLHFTIFDVINKDTLHATFEERKEWILTNISLPVGSPSVSILTTRFCEDSTMLQYMLAANKADGYEGIVAKNANSFLCTQQGNLIETQLGWCKLKHKTTEDLKLVFLDPTLERGEINYKGRRVGVKIVNKYKQYVKVGDTLEITHQGELSGGGLRHPVYQGKVIVK